MRDRQEVLDKFRELRARYLAERKAQFMGRMPINCSHNIRLRLKGNGSMGFCQNPLILSKCGPKKMFVCNEADTVARCRLFSCRSTEASVEQAFSDILASPARCGNDYPKLAMLIWFLQDFELNGRAARFIQMVRRAFSSLWGLISCRWW